MHEEATPVGIGGRGEEHTHTLLHLLERQTLAWTDCLLALFPRPKNARPLTLVQDHAGETAREMLFD